jgi:hypothetical protein
MHSKHTIAKRSGQATVEFALVLIVFLAMLYGVLEISRLILSAAAINNAAREGAHYVAIKSAYVDPTYLRRNVVAPKLPLVDAESPDLRIEGPVFPCTANCGTPTQRCGGLAPFCPVQVTVVYTWTSWVNIVPDAATWTLKPLGPIRLEGTSIRLIEGR